MFNTQIRCLLCAQVRQQLFHDRLRVELDIVEGLDPDGVASFAEVRRGPHGLGWGHKTRHARHTAAGTLQGPACVSHTHNACARRRS